MSSDRAENSNDTESICVVCFKTVELYSIGQCEHPVCYECSTRMRVLCKQNECPICRADIPRVIFTKEIESFTSLKSKTERSNLQDVNYGIYFTSPFIQSAYYRLLELNCQICPSRDRRGAYKNFSQLKDHMRREHELFYCDLCVDNLKIFAFERRCYTRQELAQHRRKGDPDNKSHRGHPLCEFCEQRYMDSDELFKHLRREHYYCHFCDADGKHQYYPSYDDLRAHFLEEHYLCEEGNCRNEQFTSAFRTDIDFKAHVASVHSKHMSRAANKQARTLEVEFNFGPRRNEQGGQRGGRRQPNSRNQENHEVGAGASNENYNTEPGGGPSAQVFVNPLRDANFPTLGNETSTVTTSRTSVTFTSKFSPNFSRDEFPTLGGGPAPRNVTITNQKVKKTEAFPSLGAPKNVTITKTSSTKSSGLSSPQRMMNSANFPSLCESTGSSSSTVKVTLNQDRPQSSRSNVSIQFNHKSNGAVTTRISTAPTTTIQVRPKTMDFQDFPALSSSSSASSAPVKQWVQPKPKKQQEPKPTKAAPAPVLPPSSLSEFPSLSKKSEKTKKTTSLTMPVSNNWASTENNTEKHSKNSDNNKQKNGDVKKDKGKKKVSDNKVVETKLVEESKTKNKKKKGKNGEASTITLSASNSENEIKKSTEPPTPINEVVKKTSTLKIGNLQPESPKIRPDDFPALGNKPPPGILVKPPPGFNFLPKNSNNLTFTSSSGQSYPILPSHTYQLPRNFTNRNAKLIENFFTDEETMKEFKQYCYLFRNGQYPPEKYYEHCQSVLGSNFSKVFPEMLVLLPDIEKQQELYKVHKRKGSVKDLEECQTCKQIIFRKDLKEHVDSHYMENHFPTLGVVEGPNAWKK